MKAVFVRAALLSLAFALGGCTTASDPIQVTRFHGAEPITRGSIAIRPFDAEHGSAGPEFDLYAGAIAQQLSSLGWSVVASSESDHVALIGLDQSSFTTSGHSPVSV